MNASCYGARHRRSCRGTKVNEFSDFRHSAAGSGGEGEHQIAVERRVCRPDCAGVTIMGGDGQTLGLSRW